MVREGDQLRHYRVLSKLGKGGMGVVFRARDEQLQRDVALKVLAPDLAGDEPARARLLREARAASALSHRGICTVYEAGQAGDEAFIAMELVDGCPLGVPLPQRGLPPETVCDYGIQIADALEHAHRRGVIHRDLKLPNLMVTPEDRVVILDFGISRRTPEASREGAAREDSLTVTGALLGTPLYLPPEVWRGAKAEARGDLWALGVVLYQLVTGKPPFAGATEHELSAAILNHEPEPLPESVPEPLRNAILRCLEKDPAQRYRTAGEVRAALETARRRPVPVAAPPRRGRPPVWLGVGALLVAAVTGTVWIADRLQGRAPEPRQRQVTFNSPENVVVAAALSPDGRLLAYPDRGGLFLRLVQTGETRPLSLPPRWRYSFPFPPDLAWSASADRVLFGDADLGTWTVPVQGGPATSLRADVSAATPSPDGSRIACLGDRGLLLLDPEGAETGVLLEGSRGQLGSPAWSPDGRWIAFLQEDAATRGRPEIRAVELTTGGTTTLWRDSLLADNALGGNRQLCWLADGRLVFPRRESTPRGNETSLWALRVDLRRARPRGRPERLAGRAGEWLGYLSATTDGRHLGFLSWWTQVDVCVGDLEAGGRLGTPRRLTLEDRQWFRLLGWTPDGLALVYARLDSAGREATAVYRQVPGEPRATEVASGGATLRWECATADSAWGFYHEWPVGPGLEAGAGGALLQLAAAGGPPRPVSGAERHPDAACSGGPHGRCVLSELEGGRLTFYELDPDRGRGRGLARSGGVEAGHYFWSLSHDGRKVALCQDRGHASSASLSLLELESGRSRVIRREGSPFFWGLEWERDGRSLIGVGSADGQDLIARIDLEGRVRPLYRTSDELLFAAPSPDARRIAFSKATHASSGWLLDGF